MVLLGSLQPPSGGCVLKQRHPTLASRPHPPAAFGRLCVETTVAEDAPNPDVPAAFGRLCVETPLLLGISLVLDPAAFGRLCVETIKPGSIMRIHYTQPPSGGCVLKLA